MHRSALYHIGILFLLLSFFSCANRGGNTQSDKAFGVCKVQLISPYGCFQEIEFTDNGNGYLKSGLHSGSTSDDNVRLDTVFSIDSFHIQKEQDLKNIRSIIASILGAANEKGVAKTDAYRHRLFVDGVSKIDLYGLSKVLHELLSHLINYLPLSNDKCEFFELYKKSMLSSH